MTPDLETLFLGIILLFVAFRGVAILPRLVLYGATAWIAEDTVIHAYGFYEYSPRWSILVDRVPLTVLLIWPIVIISAQDLAGRWAPWVVLTDAALIEPIAVMSGYWAWTAPGLFGVPPIGIAGWAIFAAWALYLEQRFPHPAVLMVGAPLLTHVSLLALWWGGLRWVSAPIPPLVGLTVALLVSLFLSFRASLRWWPARPTVLMRVPAAAFFFAALAMAAPRWELVAYALVFAPPYLILTLKGSQTEERHELG